MKLPTRPTSLFCLLGALALACGSSSTEESTTANESAASTQFTGTLSASGQSWTTHDIEIGQSGTLNLSLDWNNAGADFNVFLYNQQGQLLAYENKTAKPETLSFEVDAPGTYRVGIKCKTGSGSYTLSSDFTPDAVEHVFDGTTSASGSSWITHAFDAAAGDDISAVLDWSNASADLNLFLYDPSGALVSYANSTTARPEAVQATAQVGGTWKIALKCKLGSTAYHATVLVGGEPLPPPAPPVASYPARPPNGKLFWGAAVAGNGDPTPRHEQPAGHPLTLHRTFFQWKHRTSWMIDMAADDLAHDRLPWVSVKPPSWSAVAAGNYDTEIDQMLGALDDLPGPVWLTVHHEPEGGGGTNAPDDPAGPAGHVAMNRRVRQRITALGVDNVALAPILMSWTWTTQSGRNPNEWWEPGIYDFLGVDHYKDSQASLLDGTWAKVRVWAAERNVDVAVGEWGMRGTDAAAGQRVRDWYDSAAGSHADGGGARVVGLAAFDSGLNSPSGSWELNGAQLTTFWDLLKDPRTADVP